MYSCKTTHILFSFLLLQLILSCASDSDGDTSFTQAPCTNDPVNDSQLVNGEIQRNRSHDKNSIYHSIAVTGSNNRNVTLDYMVHTSQNPKALLILIAGGQLDARINGTEGSQASDSSGNFLVRSAHLFAAKGYKVVTLDRPSDYLDYIIPAGSTNGSAFDSYRTSVAHREDISAVIAAENTSSLPVVLTGTSRGAISAVAHHELADYLLLSAPVTSGKNGSPIGSSSVQPSSVGNKSVHVIWHENDECVVSKPQGAIDSLDDFENATGAQVSGGYNDPDPLDLSNPECAGSRTYHGFVGIETCVVSNITQWLDARIQ